MSRPGRVRRRASPSTPVQPPSSARNQLVRAPPLLTSSPSAPPCALARFFFPCFSVNYYCGDVCGLFFCLFFFFLSFSFDSLACHIW